jgi:hypothetical protein
MAKFNTLRADLVWLEARLNAAERTGNLETPFEGLGEDNFKHRGRRLNESPAHDSGLSRFICNL